MKMTIMMAHFHYSMYYRPTYCPRLYFPPDSLCKPVFLSISRRFLCGVQALSIHI
jgi:hypothetical protein